VDDAGYERLGRVNQTQESDKIGEKVFEACTAIFDDKRSKRWGKKLFSLRGRKEKLDILAWRPIQDINDSAAAELNAISDRWHYPRRHAE